METASFNHLILNSEMMATISLVMGAVKTALLSLDLNESTSLINQASDIQNEVMGFEILQHLLKNVMTVTTLIWMGEVPNAKSSLTMLELQGHLNLMFEIQFIQDR